MTTPAFIDEHAIAIAAPPDRVWTALRTYVSSLGFPETGVKGRAVALFWAADPPSGFAVVDETVGREIAVAGRHRYSRYRLAFAIAPAAGDGSVLTARSYGDFPGPAGHVYRALVIGTRAHVLAVRRMLRSVRDRVS